MRRLKAEWERQNAILIAFPHANSDWSEDLEASRIPFFKMAQAIGYSQLVYMLTTDVAQAKSYFCSTTNIIFIKTNFNDTWVRDYGALSIENSGTNELIDFAFNGWGGKFEADLDNQINQFLKAKGFLGATAMQSIAIELEGGSLESDGKGTIMTTKQCLLNKNRNGGLSQNDAEDLLFKHLGAKRVLWVENSTLAGDDTDGHIDMLARFVNPDTIAYLKCEDSSDEHFKSLQELERELKGFKRDNGAPYNLVPLPFAEAKYKDGNRLPTSYANFLITNKAVIVPTYESVQDKKAIEIIKSLFKHREIIPLPALKLIEQGGSVHCSTMQLSF